MAIRFLSCFSGIEAATVAAPPGWECVGVAEIEAFPAAVLAHHYPDVPNLGDVMKDDFIERAVALRPNIVVGGPPCQDYSVAGLRAGLNGERGNLTLRYVEIIHAVRLANGPEFLGALTENVPGWLSANDGLAFGTYLAALVGSDSPLVPPQQCGGRWTDAGMVNGPKGRAAWRVLDAQYFGLAQRRERVFVVFCPAGGADPAQILFERDSLPRHSPPRREAGKAVAAITATGVKTCGADDNQGQSGHIIIPCGIPEVAWALQERDSKGADSDTKDGHLLPVAVLHGTQDPDIAYDRAHPLARNSGQENAVCYPDNAAIAVRRLTVIECERLQGFADNYTKIPYRGKPAEACPDGPRYRSLGNSWAVKCARWVLARMDKVMRGAE